MHDLCCKVCVCGGEGSIIIVTIDITCTGEFVPYTGAKHAPVYWMCSVTFGRAGVPSEADTDREREYRAAVWLQSWVRGYRVRDRFRRLHQLAVVIQRHWRGYLGRRYYRRLLQVGHGATSQLCFFLILSSFPQD